MEMEKPGEPGRKENPITITDDWIIRDWDEKINI